MSALAGSHEPVVKLLLAKGAKVNARSRNYDALSVASEAGSEEIVKLLLDNGANVNAPGDKYGNALQVASARNPTASAPTSSIGPI